MTKQEFVNQLWPACKDVASKQMVVAHGAYESGWGVGKAYVLGRNPFNLTRNPKVSGAVVQAGDLEYGTDGSVKAIVQRFAAFPSLEDAVTAYLQFIARPRYTDAVQCLGRADVGGFLSALKRGGFFTLPLEKYIVGYTACLSSVKSIAEASQLE